MATTSHPAALVAATVTTVTLPTNAGRVEVVMKGTTPADTYFTVDGSTPTVSGTGTHYLPGIYGASLIVDAEIGGKPSGTSTVVKLISSGTPSVAVRAVGQ
jgi:hypothetical protein